MSWLGRGLGSRGRECPGWEEIWVLEVEGVPVGRRFGF